MTNSYFILPSYTTKDSAYILKDMYITNKRPILPDAFITDNEDAFYYIIINDDSTLEGISFKEYDRSDYWDLLFMINQMYTPFDLPKSSGYVIDLANEELLEWKKRFPALDAALLAEKESELITKYTDINDKHRKFRCIRKSYISLMFEALNGR